MSKSRSQSYELRQLTLQYLREHGELERDKFKKYLADIGFIYTNGTLAGVLNSVIGPKYDVERVSRGYYRLRVPGIPSVIGDLDVNKHINIVLERAIQDLRSITNVSVLDVNEDQLRDMLDIKEVIQQIETLKRN